MHHHYMIDRLAQDHLAELHAEATRSRLIRERGVRRFRLPWRRSRGAPAALVVIDNPNPVTASIQADTPRVA